jgi:hypothetical protein
VELPPLTDEESARLRASVQQDGIFYPVLLSRTGKVIDGHSRKQIAADLGIECPTKTLDVDDETAERLRVSLNWTKENSYRRLKKYEQYDLLIWLRGPETKNAAAVDRINDELKAAGCFMTVSSATMGRAVRWEGASPKDKSAVRAGRKPVAAVVDPNYVARNRRRYGREPDGVTIARLRKRVAEPRRSSDSPQERANRERLESQAKIRLLDYQKQYESMHNAPRGKLNMPLVRRIQSIQEQLDDIYEIAPDTAVLAYGPEMCRLFTPSRAEWWTKFCALNEQRWQQETPELPPIPNRRIIPLAERDLNSIERAVLDLLRKQTTAESNLDGAVSDTQVAVAVRCPESQARAALTKLYNNDLAEMVGNIEGHKLYVAT